LPPLVVRDANGILGGVASSWLLARRPHHVVEDRSAGQTSVLINSTSPQPESMPKRYVPRMSRILGGRNVQNRNDTATPARFWIARTTTASRRRMASVPLT